MLLRNGSEGRSERVQASLALLLLPARAGHRGRAGGGRRRRGETLSCGRMPPPPSPSPAAVFAPLLEGKERVWMRLGFHIISFLSWRGGVGEMIQIERVR